MARDRRDLPLALGSYGIFAVYAFNARKSLSVRTIVATMWGFSRVHDGGRFITMAFPTALQDARQYYVVRAFGFTATTVKGSSAQRSGTRRRELSDL